jgi:hypothetical protein
MKQLVGRVFLGIFFILFVVGMIFYTFGIQQFVQGVISGAIK